jgi:type II secretion system protein G
MRNFNKKGFTLIEMLIVVVIIGILAAALIPRLSSVKDKADDSSRKANLQQLVTAMSSYALDNDITKLATGYAGSDSPIIAAALTGGGMKTIPTDPQNASTKIFGVTTS